ncbi:MAG TPA: alpha/beta hydrolase [Roseiflexaceae bacterium]|jgi:pimeloyl-ACP methyl ester carboxylesterase|nr:alpha/beta hydrolase [Roseiflexaceae bacterium]
MFREPKLVYSQARDVRLALWEWPGAEPPLVFVHATGFHGRCWDEVIAHFPDQRCLAVDMRGHGRSDKPAPPYHWRAFGEDLAALLHAHDMRGAVGIGHSMGGHSVTLAAALVPEIWSQLVLLDPVILPPERYTGPHPVEHFAARRRNRWSSPDEMIARFAPRPPFNRWQPAVLRDYCAYGLLPAPDGGGYVLACPPQIEADIYRNSTAANIYHEIAQVRVPVTVVRMGQPTVLDAWNMEGSPTAPDLAAIFSHGRDLHIPEYTHFMPMESPERVANIIREALHGND